MDLFCAASSMVSRPEGCCSILPTPLSIWSDILAIQSQGLSAHTHTHTHTCIWIHLGVYLIFCLFICIYFFVSECIISKQPRCPSFRLENMPSKIHSTKIHTIYSKQEVLTLHTQAHLLQKKSSFLLEKWDIFLWESLSIAPGLLSKQLLTHLTLFKL